MKWRTYCSVLGLALLLFLASCSGKHKDAALSCQLGGNVSTYDSCVREEAEVLGPKFCDFVSSDVRDVCLMHAAIGKDRPKVCRTIFEPGIQDMCYGSVALYNGRMKEIENIQENDKKSEWYSTIALRKTDPEACNKITWDWSAHGHCYFQLAKKTNDPEHCFFIESNTIHKDACYLYMAKTLQNKDYCLGVKGQIQRTRCYYDDDYVAWNGGAGRAA